MNYDGMSQLRANDLIEVRFKDGHTANVRYGGPYGNEALIYLENELPTTIPCELVIRKVTPQRQGA